MKHRNEAVSSAHDQFVHDALIRLSSVLSIVVLVATAGVGANALAFDELSGAQQLVYAHDHLRDTKEGESVTYLYESMSPEEDAVRDSVTLTIDKSLDDGKRDVSIEFLTDDRRMILPPFKGYKGNPVVIAMLEHVAQAAGKETGGGTLYFRNRIRDSLAEQSLTVQTSTQSYGDGEIETKEIVVMPFVDDKFLKGNKRYENMKYRLVFSDAAPAGVVEVSAESVDDDGRVTASRSLKLAPANG